MASASSLGMFIANGAALFWTITYILVIVHGFREKRPMIPTFAIMLNFGWEFLAVFVWPAYNTDMKYGSIVWLAIDVIIVYQLFRFGATKQRIAELRQHWPSVVLVGLILSVVGHGTFSVYNADPFGLEDSYIINLVMSILFVGMYLTFRDGSKLARWIAWTKMIGTACASVGLTIIMNAQSPTPDRSPLFIYYLMGMCFLFDVLYVALVSGTLREAERVPAPAV